MVFQQRRPGESPLTEIDDDQRLRMRQDLAGFRKRWPRLLDKFWNQERIREIVQELQPEKKT